MITAEVRERILALDPALPAYVYDLGGLERTVTGIADALAEAGVEFFYAAKANPDPELLAVIAQHADGIEVASGGELAHVRKALPEARIAFGGPGKTDAELTQALADGVERIHLESPWEAERLARISASGDRPVGVLLRANLPIATPGAALSMTGPFGMDVAGLAQALRIVQQAEGLEFRGIHTHLASGLDAAALLAVDRQILAWARPWMRRNAPRAEHPEVVLGGGMAVDYAHPERRFDWGVYAGGLSALAGPEQLRVEPGRSVSVHDGYYVTDVLDVKTTRGQAYAILRGGTHHLRTPATKGHSQPCTIIHRDGSGPSISGPATLAGQLCTPKDVLAQGVPVENLTPGDLVVFELAGAYAWNISHHDFLMHPRPSFTYLP